MIPFEQAQRLHNVTIPFIKMLRGESKYFRSAFKMLIIGMPGSGKTLFAFMIICEMMTADENRLLCLFKASKTVLKIIKKYFPFPDRVYVADNLDDIKNNSIVLCDESLLFFNAKEALKTEMRQIGKALAFVSHKRICFILNSQDEGVIKDFRMKADILVYKTLGNLFVKESRDPIVQEYKDLLVAIPQEKSVVISNYKNFRKQGYIFINKANIDRAIPWWNDEISTSLNKQSLDSEMEQENDIQKKEEGIIKTMFELYGNKRLVKPGVSKLIAGYLYDNDKKLYRQFKNRFNEMANVCYFRACMALKDKEDEEDTIADDREIPTPVWGNPKTIDAAKTTTATTKETFADFCKERYAGDKDASKMVEMFLKGKSVADIRAKIGKQSNWVQEQLRTFRETDYGYLFEIWFAQQHGGGKTGGNTSEIDYTDQQGNIYSLKARYNRESSLTFHQEIDMHPEYVAAKAQGKHYTLVVFNPCWGSDPVENDVDPNGDDKIVVRSKVPANARKKEEHKITTGDLQRYLLEHPEFAPRMAHAMSEFFSLTLGNPEYANKQLTDPEVIEFFRKALAWDGDMEMLKYLILLAYKGLNDKMKQ